MVELKKSTGSSKLIKLTLVSLVISAILWLFWGFVTLRDTSCGWANRIKGSDCVRIISRDVDFGAEKVYFSTDDSSVIYLDHGAIKVEPVQKKTPFSAAKSYSIFSPEDSHSERGIPRWFENFAFNPDEMEAVFCAIYKVDEHNYNEVIIFRDLENENAPKVFLDDMSCAYSGMDFAPSSSVVALNTYEDEGSKVRFVDSSGDILHPVQGVHYYIHSDGIAIIPIREADRVISLYSFPDLHKQNEFEFPADVAGALMSPDGRYVFASDSNDATIYMLDVSTGNIINTFSEPSYRDANLFSVSLEGDLLAIAFSGYDGKVVNAEPIASIDIWDLKTMTVIKKIPTSGIYMDPRSVDISSDGKYLVVGTLRYVIIYDLTK